MCQGSKLLEFASWTALWSGIQEALWSLQGPLHSCALPDIMEELSRVLGQKPQQAQFGLLPQ